MSVWAGFLHCHVKESGDTFLGGESLIALPYGGDYLG